jgi:hypothetical protein
LASHGLKKADLRRIRELIEAAQGNPGDGEKFKSSRVANVFASRKQPA